MGLDREKKGGRDAGREASRPAVQPARQPDRLRQAGRVGFEQARANLGFTDRAGGVEWSAGQDGDALRPHVPVPGALADLARDRGPLAVGGALDLLESEQERRRRLAEARLTGWLKGRLPGVRSVGELLGSDPSMTPAEAGLPLLQRSLRVNGARAHAPYQAVVELALGGDGVRIDVATSQVPRLVGYALENGPEWVLEEVRKIREWVEERRPCPEAPAAPAPTDEDR
jgi:hypothetical protein